MDPVIPLINSSSKQILAKLTDEEARYYFSMSEHVRKVSELQAELAQLQAGLSQMYSFFWGKMMMPKNERCETLAARKKAMTICRTEDNELVLVQTNVPPGLINPPCQNP